MKIIRLFIITFFINFSMFAGERIVTLSPSLNEIVFALGSGKDIVANTLYSNYPKESILIPKVGGYASISLEKILRSNPSIIFTQDYNEKLLESLKKLKLNFCSFKTNNLDSIKNTIRQIGKILRKEAKAKELITQINKEMQSIQNIVKEKKIMIVITPRVNLNNSIYISGNNLYFDDIINYSGNKNAYQSKSKNQPVVNVEKIISMNPDIIILLAPFINKKRLTKVMLKSAWKNIPINASINDNIYVIDKDYAGIPSNRVIFFIKDFKKILLDVKSK